MAQLLVKLNQLQPTDLFHYIRFGRILPERRTRLPDNGMILQPS